MNPEKPFSQNGGYHKRLDDSRIRRAKLWGKNKNERIMPLQLPRAKEKRETCLTPCLTSTHTSRRERFVTAQA